MRDLIRLRVNAPCPICGVVFHPGLEDVRLERTVSCPNGHAVKLHDQDRGVRKLDRQLGDIERKFRRASFKIRRRH